eukprot:g1683.t1
MNTRSRRARRKRWKSFSSSSSCSDGDDRDDSVGHFYGSAGSFIGETYKIIEECGLGTFGKVFACEDTKNGNIVAIKVVRCVRRYTESARIEADMLREINDSDPEGSSHNVRMLDMFHFQGHACLVFERLGPSLYQFLKANRYRAFPFRAILRVARDTLVSIAHLHRMCIAHTDLKLENVLLSSLKPIDAYRAVDIEGTSYRVLDDASVKVIDFGSATSLKRESHSRTDIIQTRQYRAPEVTLGLGWGLPADIWSVGCLIMETFLGDLLFDTHDDLEHLALIERCVGSFPVETTRRCRDFFHSSDGKLRYFTDRRVRRSSRDHVRDMLPLPRLIRAKFRTWHDPVEEPDARLQEQFSSVMQGLLTLDPLKRWTAARALEHPLFRAVHPLSDGGDGGGTVTLEGTSK